MSGVSRSSSRHRPTACAITRPHPFRSRSRGNGCRDRARSLPAPSGRSLLDWCGQLSLQLVIEPPRVLGHVGQHRAQLLDERRRARVRRPDRSVPDRQRQRASCPETLSTLPVVSNARPHRLHEGPVDPQRLRQLRRRRVDGSTTGTLPATDPSSTARTPAASRSPARSCYRVGSMIASGVPRSPAILGWGFRGEWRMAAWWSGPLAPGPPGVGRRSIVVARRLLVIAPSK